MNSSGKMALLLTGFLGFLPLLTQELVVQTVEFPYSLTPF